MPVFVFALFLWMLLGLACLLLDVRFDAIDRRIRAMRSFYEEQLLVNKMFKREKQFESVELVSLIEAYDATRRPEAEGVGEGDADGGGSELDDRHERRRRRVVHRELVEHEHSARAEAVEADDRSDRAGGHGGGAEGERGAGGRRCVPRAAA